MDTESQTNNRRIVRNVGSLGLIFALLHFANATDALSDVTRPIVVGILQACGFLAQDLHNYLQVEHLLVPWTRDCAGLSVLTILWALALWTNRNEPISTRYWVKLLIAIPISFLANVLRILTLIGLRALIYPDVESGQLHYFVGFLWLLPFLPVFIPKEEKPFAQLFLESLYLAACLSVVAPLVNAPGGSWVAISCLFYLAHHRFRKIDLRKSWWILLGWIAGAGAIAVTSMESLWLPWLRTCPYFVSTRVALSLPGWIILAGTLNIISMHPWAIAAVSGSCFWLIWRFYPGEKKSDERSILETKAPIWQTVPLFAFLMVPFVASFAVIEAGVPIDPPTSCMVRKLESNGYELRYVGQPRKMRIYWFEPSGQSRHHTLEVCMKYRGIELTESDKRSDIMTDGNQWMREFFIQDEALIDNYREYVKETILPLSDPGIHIIVAAPSSSISVEGFDATTRNTIKRIHKEILAELHP